MAVKVSADNFVKEVLLSDEIVIADFYSDSCVPCKRISPILSEIEEENMEIRIAKINVNIDHQTPEKYGVTSVPTLIIFKKGEEKARIVGAVRKSVITEAIASI